MIKYKQGDLLTVTEGIIAHGCNAQGVMSSGVAKLIKDKYPLAYDDYLFHLKYEKNPLGTVSVIKVDRNLWIANCITQRNYGRDPDIVYVDYLALANCFDTLNSMVLADPKPLHIPKIGAGLANGDWETIENKINMYGPEDVTCWTL